MNVNLLGSIFGAAMILICSGDVRADDICSDAAGGECEAAQELTDLADDTPTVPDELVEEAQDAIDTQDDNVNN